MSGGPAQAEVKIKLVLDSNAEVEAKKLSAAIQHAGKTATKGKKSPFFSMDTSGLKSGAMSAVGGLTKGLMAVGGAASAAYATVSAVGGLAAHAFMESEVQVRELAGTFATLDENGYSLERIHDYASDTKDELEAMGMAAGVSDDTLVAVFNDVIERGGKSVEAAKDLTQQMAYAGRAVPGGAATLSQAFEAIQMGMVKAKNPIVGMIASTGMLKGNAKAVAAQMMKMSPAEQMALAEKAIGRMSEKMKKLPMTIEQMGTSMKVMGGNLMETMGSAIVARLGQGMTTLRSKFFDDNGQATPLVDKLTHGAEMVGEFLAKYIQMGVDVADSFYRSVEAFFPLIKESWAGVFGEGDEAFIRWEEGAKDVAKALGTVVGALVAGTGTLIKYIEKLFGYLKQAALWTTDKLGTNDDGSVNKTGRAVNKFLLEGDQAQLLSQAGKTGGGGMPLRMREQYIENARLSGEDQVRAGEIFDNALKQRSITSTAISNASSAAEIGNAQQFVDNYNIAAKAHDEAAQKNILQFLASHEDMATAIGVLGPQLIEGGARQFTSLLGEVGGEGAAKKFIEASKLKIGGAKGPTPINLNGGQTFNIKQDFKEVDADRIAFMMNGDIMKSAIDRIQSNGVKAGSSF